MTQDMATYFNQAFSPDRPVLRRPEYRLSQTPYVPGLDGAKMSKSYGNTIPLFESGKALRKRVGKIVTSATPLGQPLPVEGDNVLALLRLFCPPERIAEIEGWYRAGARDGEPFGYGHAKQILAAEIELHFAEARTRRQALLADPDQVERALRQSAAKARALAQRTMHDALVACGLRQP
jgi:tryptophanyl-tRNA synthetase